MNELPMLQVRVDAELLERVEEFNPPEQEVFGTYAHLIVAQRAAEQPDALSVSSRAGELTYRELNDRADAVANWLSSESVGEEQVVGVLGERNADFLIAMLGIWKAGATYLPIDLTWPRSRSAGVLQQAGCTVVLTTTAPGPDWADAGDTTARLVPVTDTATTAGPPARLPDSELGRLAYVIFTSGSTGRPKGAMVEQAGMLNHLFAKVTDLDLTGADRVMQNSSQAFDISVWQFVAPLIVGGSVRIADDEVAHDPVLLLAEADSTGVTVLEVVPSMLHMMLEYLESAAERPALGSLRWLLATGEVLSPELCRRWLTLYPSIPLLNAYGPTECSDDVTHHPIHNPPETMASSTPIGRPVANARLYVLKQENDEYSLCAPGEKGELFVAGPGVGRGYLNDLEETAKAFFRDPFRPDQEGRIYRTGDMVRIGPDGNLEFFGRIDRQVKVRGHRIQPEEIEGALKEHPRVQDAVVLLSEADDESQHGKAGETDADARLVAYVQPHWRNAPTIAGHPRHELPNGMAIARHTRSETDFLYADIFERGAYYKHGLRIHPGDCVVDVGGNIGLFSLFAHEESRGGQVYAFEPVPDLCELLRENLRLFGVNAQVYQCGLAAEPGSTTITYYPGFSTLSGLYPDDTQDKDVALSFVRHRRDREPELALESSAEDELIEGLLEHRFESQRREISLMKLSDFITENEIAHIDFLKINVEGAELDVLNGIDPDHWPRIGQIALETHDFEGRLDHVVGILKGEGFEVGIEQDWSIEQSMRTNFYVYARRPETSRAVDSTTPAPREPSGYREAAILTDTELREFLRERLPEYMTPSAYRFMERLPLMSTGKVDRRKLAERQAEMNELESEDAVQPRTETEQALLDIWKEVLVQDRIGVYHDFFDCGGDSLLGARMVTRVRTTMGAELLLKSVFEYPTVAAFAKAVDAARAAES